MSPFVGDNEDTEREKQKLYDNQMALKKIQTFGPLDDPDLDPD